MADTKTQEPVAVAVPVQAQQGQVPTQQVMQQQPGQPVQVVQQPGQPQVIYVQAPQDPRLACRGIQPGGVYTNEKYCGVISWIIGLLLFPCICCCPCDEREVYIEPGTGRRVVLAKTN